MKKSKKRKRKHIPLKKGNETIGIKAVVCSADYEAHLKHYIPFNWNDFNMIVLELIQFDLVLPGLNLIQFHLRFIVFS